MSICLFGWWPLDVAAAPLAVVFLFDWAVCIGCLGVSISNPWDRLMPMIAKTKVGALIEQQKSGYVANVGGLVTARGSRSSRIHSDIYLLWPWILGRRCQAQRCRQPTQAEKKKTTRSSEVRNVGEDVLECRARSSHGFVMVDQGPGLMLQVVGGPVVASRYDWYVFLFWTMTMFPFF